MRTVVSNQVVTRKRIQRDPIVTSVKHLEGGCTLYVVSWSKRNTG